MRDEYKYAIGAKILAAIVRQSGKKVLLFVARTCTLLHNRIMIFNGFCFVAVQQKLAKTGSGRRGRMFESCHSDQFTAKKTKKALIIQGFFRFYGAFRITYPSPRLGYEVRL